MGMMLAAVYRGPNNITVQEVPVAKGKVTLKVNACAICGYDARVYRSGHRKVSPPVILGHELCGEIQNDILLDDSGTIIKSGTRVAICPLTPCLNCHYCQTYRYNLCTNLKEIGSTLDGGFAQYMAIPDEIIRIGGVVPLPANMTNEEASLLEPLACCLNSFSRLPSNIIGKEKIRPDVVVIIGDGPIGLLHLQLFKNIAKARVAVVGKVPARMAKARSMGADAAFIHQDSDIDSTIRAVLDFADPAVGANVAVISTSSPTAFELAKKIVGKDSVIDLFASMPSGQVLSFDANWLHYNEVSVISSFSSTPEMLQKATLIAAAKTVDLSKIITHRYSLADIEEALQATENYYGLRAVINKL
jgi:L-iditol 2-dehydrogenase